MRDRDWDNGFNAPGKYDVAQVCLNGRAILSSVQLTPECTSKFCPECGQPTITTCQKCKTTIRGDYYQLDADPGSWTVPAFCHECGAAYPWTERRTEALALAIDESELPENDRNKLTLLIPDVINDTPKTQVATSLFGKAIRSAGQFGGKLIYDVLVKVGTEFVVRSLTSPQD